MNTTPLETQSSLVESIVFARGWYDESTGLRKGLQKTFKEIMSDLISDKKAMLIYEEWLFRQTESTYFLIASKLLFAAVIYRQQNNDDRKRLMMKLAKEEKEFFNVLIASK